MAVPFHVPDAANPATSSSPPSAVVTSTTSGSMPQTPQPQNPSAQHSPLLSPLNSEHLVQAFCEALYRYSRVQGGWWRVFICWNGSAKEEWKKSDIKVDMKAKTHKKNLVIFKCKTENEENFNLSFVKGVWTYFRLDISPSSASKNKKLVDQNENMQNLFFVSKNISKTETETIWVGFESFWHWTTRNFIKKIFFSIVYQWFECLIGKKNICVV